MNQPFQIPDAMAFEDSRAPATTARNRQLAWLAGSAALAVVALGGWHFVGQHGAAPAAPPPAVVAVAQPLQRQVTQWDDYVGRFAPSRTGSKNQLRWGLAIRTVQEPRQRGG